MDSYTGRTLRSLAGEILSWKSLLVFVFIIIIAGWLPEGLASVLGIFMSEKTVGLLQLILSALLTVGIFIYAKISLKRDVKYRVVQVNAKAQSFKVLTIFLSEEDSEKLSEYRNMRFPEEILRSDKRYKWEMPVRGIMEHADSLRKLYVLCSPKSENNFEDFKELIHRLFGNLEVVHAATVDFNNLKEVSEAIEKIYETETSKGIKEEEIVVDITSGTKITSIAGCASTIPYPNRYFQYVTSSGPKEVKVFNMDLID